MSTLPDFLGSYRLTRFIRTGSSCQVWEAIKDDGSGHYVLKVLRSDHWGNREEIGCLRHEYEVAHGLSHPNIIRVLDFKSEGKIAYLVLEVFSILNLKQSLRENHQRIVFHFSKIVEQSTSALQHLHEKKWVHCDVKPDNFLFNEDEKVKLIDFTISQRLAKGPIGRLFGKRGKVQGTRSYMSPEQIRGNSLDARSDVYSFGCVMFELLSNKLPYTGFNPDDLLSKHLKAPVPSVQVHNNLVTTELAALIRRMMAKDPKQRPASMLDVLKEFRGIRAFKSPPKLPESAAKGKAESDD